MELVELSGRITGRLGYDYRLRHRRDGIAGTTILYHLRIYRRPHSPSGTTAGRRELLGMGTAAASAGAAGPSEGLRAGRSSGRTKPEYTAPSGRHDHATTGAGRRVSPTTGTRSQTTCYTRRGAGRVLFIIRATVFLSDSQRSIGEGESDQETIASFLATA